MDVTLTSIENILALVGSEWWGPWQQDIARFIIDNESSIVQAPRQTGKTYILALLCVANILAGKSVIIAYPILAQAKRLLFREIKRQMAILKGYYPKGCLRKDVDTNTEILWKNGGSLLAISLDTGAQKEGYTADVLIIDEAHRATDEVLGLCLPFLLQAKLRGEGKLVFLGIGGHVKSLVETEKEHHPSLKVLPSEIIEQDSRYEAIFKEFEDQLPPVEYEQHILLHSVSEGLQRLFPEILMAEPVSDPGMIYFGIDVGEKRDYTLVTALRHSGDYYDLVDVFRTKGDFIDQSGGQEQRIAEFIKQHPHRNENITIELNFNSMLGQSLQTNHFFGMNGIHLLYKNKKALSDALINIVKEGKFRVVNEEYKKDLESLRFNIKVNGTWEWSHSDLFSSLLMAMASLQQPQYF